MAKKKRKKNKNTIDNKMINNRPAEQTEVVASPEEEPRERTPLTAQVQAPSGLNHAIKSLVSKIKEIVTKVPAKVRSHSSKGGFQAFFGRAAERAYGGLREFKTACRENKKCAMSAALGALSLVLGLTALLSLGTPDMSGNSGEGGRVPAFVNTGEPLVHNHKEEDPAKALKHYTKVAVTGVPVSVGLARPRPLILRTESGAEPQFKSGDSCEVVYERSIAKVTSALNVENPFNIFKTVYNLRVNGEIKATFKTPGEGRQVMDKIVALNTGEKSEIVKLEYKEDVEITKDEASFLEDATYSKVDEAVGFLMTGTKEMQKYVIVAGDIPETIAEAHGMTIEELEAANPSIVGRGHLLQIGEELNLVIPKPLINVMTTERRSYVKNVDYEIVEHADAEMYEGDVVVQEEGEYGRSEVVAEVVRENGREIGRTILSEKVLKQPKKQIVTVGTKPAPPRRGSGYLDYPIQRGFEVSSPFGMRWGFLHSGIDLACPQGTPIVAADGGIVTFAGWDSLGGLMVKIDHGGNISTGYAHCDYLAVSEGDQVFKGQYIADVGMTGYTTGPHLHFEVLYNGVYTDPSEYLAFY